MKNNTNNKWKRVIPAIIVSIFILASLAGCSQNRESSSIDAISDDNMSIDNTSEDALNSETYTKGHENGNSEADELSSIDLEQDDTLEDDVLDDEFLEETNTPEDSSLQTTFFEDVEYPRFRDMVTNISEFYGGSYLNEEGNSVVLLTEETESNRKAICLALGISEANTIFQPAKYTLEYMTSLLELVNKESLDFVTDVSFLESQNKIQVTVVTDNEEELDNLHKLDTLGGALDIIQDKENMWNLLLVNPWNTMPEDFSVDLVSIGNGHSIDARAYDDFKEMMADAKNQGMSMFVCSSYRTNNKQTTLYNNKVNKYIAQGYSRTLAEEKAGMWVARPGTSEHQLGLALDIVSTSYTELDKQQENTKEQKWLMANSYKYGFILRYPSDKCDITGIGYEPWHYRYVGKVAAKEIYERGICLEEYLQ